jgi:predicted amidohydrolase YtcJ
VDQALRVNTINGAYASHEEAIKGSITPGKLADFVVLADDPHTVDKEKIEDIAIVRTVTAASRSTSREGPKEFRGGLSGSLE